MRTYEQTRPWLQFRWEPRRTPYPVWLLLGEGAAMAGSIGALALPPSAARELEREAWIGALHAMAASEGNTLTLAQVADQVDGRLQLPSAESYLTLEIDNLRKAVQWTLDRIKAGDRQFGAWSLQLLNAQVLKGSPWQEDVAPGEYRSPRREVSAGSGAPAEDIPFLVDRLCEWLAVDRFVPEHGEEQVPFMLVRASLAHLYLLWIRPFAEGNERAAMLVQLQLLLEAGVLPLVAYHQAMATHRTRAMLQREVTQCTQAGGDPIPFIASQARAMVDALGALQRNMFALQHEALLDQHLQALFGADHSANGERRRQLVLHLRQRHAPVPMDRIALLTPQLAASYARLSPKTLQRDIAHLQGLGLLQRVGNGIQASGSALRTWPGGRS